VVVVAKIPPGDEGHVGFVEQVCRHHRRVGYGLPTERTTIIRSDIGKDIERPLRLQAGDPGMALSIFVMTSRRRWNSCRMISTLSCGPFKASTAAFWAIEVGLDVFWLWYFVMAAMISSAPAQYRSATPSWSRSWKPR